VQLNRVDGAGRIDRVGSKFNNAKFNHGCKFGPPSSDTKAVAMPPSCSTLVEETSSLKQVPHTGYRLALPAQLGDVRLAGACVGIILDGQRQSFPRRRGPRGVDFVAAFWRAASSAEARGRNALGLDFTRAWPQDQYGFNAVANSREWVEDLAVVPCVKINH